MKRPAQAVAKLTQLVFPVFPTRLHLRNDLHVARKLWHLSMGLSMVFVYMSGISRTAAVITLGCILGFDLLGETARLRIPSLNERVIRLWGPLMRSSEIDRLSGVPYYLGAAILTVGIFPKPIAVLSILYLALGDPIASFFGILYGKKSIQFRSGKSLIGTFAGVTACMLATLVFLGNGHYDLTNTELLILAVVGGIAGGTAELLPLDVDDNFSIPIVSGFALWLAFILLGL